MCNTDCMARNLSFLLLSALAFLNLALPAGAKPSMGEVLAASKPSDWRPLDPANTLYVELPSGRIIIELNSGFAPLHVANIKSLVGARYFDCLPVLRVVGRRAST